MYIERPPLKGSIWVPLRGAFKGIYRVLGFRVDNINPALPQGP